MSIQHLDEVIVYDDIDNRMQPDEAPPALSKTLPTSSSIAAIKSIHADDETGEQKPKQEQEEKRNHVDEQQHTNQDVKEDASGKTKMIKIIDDQQTTTSSSSAKIPKKQLREESLTKKLRRFKVIIDHYLRGEMKPVRDFLFTKDHSLASICEFQTISAILCDCDVLASFVTSLAWFVVSIIDIVLRGVSQVYLVNNSICGLFITAGLATSSDPLRAPFALAGSLLGLAGGAFAHDGRLFPDGIEGNDLVSGLYGYDAVLVAVSIRVFLSANSDVFPSSSSSSSSSSNNTSTTSTFFDNDGFLFACAVVLCFICGALRKSTGRLLGVFQLPAFTITFNAVMFLCYYAIQSKSLRLVEIAAPTNSNITNTSSFFIISSSSSSSRSDEAVFWIDSFIIGVGQLVFVDTRTGSILVLAGLLWASAPMAAQAVFGSIVGGIFSFVLAAWPFDKRLVVAEVLSQHHSIITSNTTTSSSSSSSSASFVVAAAVAVNNMKTLRDGLFGYNAVATSIVAFGSSTSQAERINLQRLFESIDANGDGGVDQNELRTFLEHLVKIHERRLRDDRLRKRSNNIAEAEKLALKTLSSDKSIIVGHEIEQNQQDEEHDDDDEDEEEEEEEEETIEISDQDMKAFFDEIPKQNPKLLSYAEFTAWWTHLQQYITALESSFELEAQQQQDQQEQEQEQRENDEGIATTTTTTTTSDTAQNENIEGESSAADFFQSDIDVDGNNEDSNNNKNASQQEVGDGAAGGLIVLDEQTSSFSSRVLSALMFIFVTVYLTGAFKSIVAPFPVMTIPFTVASWLLLLGRHAAHPDMILSGKSSSSSSENQQQENKDKSKHHHSGDDDDADDNGKNTTPTRRVNSNKPTPKRTGEEQQHQHQQHRNIVIINPLSPRAAVPRRSSPLPQKPVLPQHQRLPSYGSRKNPIKDHLIKSSYRASPTSPQAARRAPFPNNNNNNSTSGGSNSTNRNNSVSSPRGPVVGHNRSGSERVAHALAGIARNNK